MANIDLGYEPRDWQRQAHLSRKRFNVLALHRRAGKALDVNTPIPVWPSGFKRNGDLVAGDVVFDENGGPCNVVYAHDVMYNRRCVSVEFSDGTSIVCDEEHLWHTRTKLDRTNRVGRTVQQNGKMSSGVLEPLPGYAKQAKDIEATIKYAGENNHSIELCGPVEWAHKSYAIPPYVLGCWLGDGNSRTAHITTMDEEIVARFQEFADQNGYALREIVYQNSGKATTYSVTKGSRAGGPLAKSMQQDLRALGVLGNKHIPDTYLHGSVVQRKELFAGLMDTDGSIDKGGRKAEITLKNQRLADDVTRLAQSLGLKPTKNRKVVNGVDYWRVNFTPLFNPFSLKRKRERWSAPTDRQQFSQQRMIVSVTEVPSRPVRCITVDSNSHLYLCGHQCVPTHNTVLSTMELIDKAIAFEKDLGFFAYVAPFLRQAKAVAWAMLKQRVEPLRQAGAVEIGEVELSIKFKHNQATIRLFGADNPDAMRGLRLDGVVIDEVAQIRPEVWQDVVQPALSDRKGWAIFIGTPNGINLFSEIFFAAEKLPEWTAARYTVYDTDALDKEEVERLKRDMPERAFAREFLCDFEAGGEDQLIPLSLVEEAARRFYDHKDPLITSAPRVLGVDPARFGDDRSVVVLRQGLKMFEPYIYQGLDNMELASQVARHISELQPDAVFVDAGAGAGVIDRLRQLGHDVIEVPFSGKANRDDLYVNRRAEMWWSVKEWLQNGGAIPDITGLKQELATPTYKYTLQGKRQLESKDQIKERLMGSSPDIGDALCVSFAHPVQKRAMAKGRVGVKKEYDPYAYIA